MKDEQTPSDVTKASDKKKYVALTGIDFDGLKGKPRVEKGGPIPEGLTMKQIKEYIQGGLIKEV